MTRRRPAADAGFTLVELLVVVLVLGVLSALAVPVFLAQQNKASDAAVVSDLSNARTALGTIVTLDDEPRRAIERFGLSTSGGTSGFEIHINSERFADRETTDDWWCLQQTSASGTTFVALSGQAGVQPGTCDTTEYDRAEYIDGAWA